MIVKEKNTGKEVSVEPKYFGVTVKPLNVFLRYQTFFERFDVLDWKEGDPMQCKSLEDCDKAQMGNANNSCPNGESLTLHYGTAYKSNGFKSSNW